MTEQTHPPQADSQACSSAAPKFDESMVVCGRLIPPGEPIKMSRGCYTGSVWMVEIQCPWCRKKHWHGWWAPGEDVTVPTRKSHCEVGGIYRIVILEESGK